MATPLHGIHTKTTGRRVAPNSANKCVGLPSFFLLLDLLTVFPFAPLLLVASPFPAPLRTTAVQRVRDGERDDEGATGRERRLGSRAGRPLRPVPKRKPRPCPGAFFLAAFRFFRRFLRVVVFVISSRLVSLAAAPARRLVGGMNKPCSFLLSCFCCAFLFSAVFWV